MKKKGMLCHLFDKTHEKIWMIMKLCIIFVVFLTFTTYAKSSGQEQTVSLKLNQASFYELFEAIRQQTGLRFLYNADQLKQMPVVNVSADNKKVRDVLTDVLLGTPLTFMFDKDVVMLVKRTDAAQQQKTVKILGQVTDEKKQPLPGVTIMVKGTKVGTATDKDGKYRFTAPQTDNLIFIYSFIGMIPVEEKYAGKDTINVVMKEEVASLDEVQVVATGYQTMDRRDVVAAYKVVKAEDIMMPSYTSIDKMLQGQVAGMVVTSKSSRVGTSPKIEIRGTSTLLGNTDPLWVVDGIIQPDPIKLSASAQMTSELSTIIGNQISWLNPMDIETLTVLKDASATAIYGSKASNGVIVVTTKRGKADRLTVNYTGNVSFTARPTYDRFNVMNSQERIMFSEEAIEWGSYSSYAPVKQMNTYEGAYRMFLEGDISEVDFINQKKKLESVNTDWLKLLTQNAITHSHTLSVSGGSEKFTYNASFGYSKADGQEIGNENERYTARMAFDAQLRENVRLAVSANGTSSNTLSFTGIGVNPLTYATETSRAIPAFDEHGDLLFYQQRTQYTYNENVQSLGFNIINERDNSGSTVRDFVLSTAIDFKWDIISGLTYQFTGGYNRTTKNSENYQGERTYKIAQEYRGYDYGTITAADPEFKAAALPFGGKLYTNDVTQSAYNIQNKLLITKSFDADNRLNAMIGMEIRSSRNMRLENTVWGYIPGKGDKLARPTAQQDFKPIGGYGTINGLSVLDEIYNTLKPAWGRGDQTDNYFSWFATLAYSFKNRYVLNANIRNDASNRFGQDVTSRLDPTYSFGLSWRVSEESFVQEHLSWIRNFNLRATYGIQGNALSNKSNDLILQTGGYDKVYNQFFSNISDIPNPLLSWERTTSWNFGLDMDLFNIFSVNAEYYRRSSNAIVRQDIAYEYGKTSMEINGGLVDNNGVELTVAFTPVRRKDFVISLNINSSKNWNSAKNMVVKPTYDKLLSPSSEKLAYEGYPLGSFWSYSFAGLNPETGLPTFNYFDVPEDERDANMDPTKFMVWSGQATPNFTGGVGLGIRYKTLLLSTDFSLLLGAKKRLPSPFKKFQASGTGAIPETYYNLSRDLLKRWKNPGDENTTNIPALMRGNETAKLIQPDKVSRSVYTLWEQSDAMVVDASFLRCRQINLTWNMDRELCKRIGLKTLSLSATVDNVFVVASKRFNGFDPELDNSIQPRAYSLGVNVGF